MPVNGKKKGKNGELELARKLKEYGYDVRRSVQYNGKAEEGEADLIGLPGIHVECKRVERLQLYDAVDQAKGTAKEQNSCLLCSTAKTAVNGWQSCRLMRSLKCTENMKPDWL